METSSQILKEHKILLRKRFQVRTRVADLLSIEELSDIETFGQWLAGLEHRRIPAFTAQQERFIEVCEGKKSPVKPLEKTWLKYKKLRARRVMCGFCAGKGRFTDPYTMAYLFCERCAGSGKEFL